MLTLISTVRTAPPLHTGFFFFFFSLRQESGHIAQAGLWTLVSLALLNVLILAVGLCPGDRILVYNLIGHSHKQ